MNIRELKNKLTEAGIREDFFSLTGGLPNEAFCIGEIDDGWEVYYSERGSKSKREFFFDESQACNFFYDLITSDEAVMNNLKD